MKSATEERIEKMRNGETIKCSGCKDGFFSAVGDPKTTHVFKCSHCQSGITLTIPMK